MRALVGMRLLGLDEHSGVVENLEGALLVRLIAVACTAQEAAQIALPKDSRPLADRGFASTIRPDDQNRKIGSASTIISLDNSSLNTSSDNST